MMTPNSPIALPKISTIKTYETKPKKNFKTLRLLLISYSAYHQIQRHSNMGYKLLIP